MLVHTEKTVVSRSYLSQICSGCKQEVDMEKGEVIFDGKCYHKQCWATFLENREKGELIYYE